MIEKRKVKQDRRENLDLSAGRRSGHNRVVKRDQRKSSSIYGRRVRQRRGGRWRTSDRRVSDRRIFKAKRDSTTGVFFHPVHGEVVERRSFLPEKEVGRRFQAERRKESK